MQRERSADGILEDCLAGLFGSVTILKPATVGHVPPVARTTAPIRLEALTVSDFRAYRKPQTFELGSDLTVLYGPNGFGKTSFFDAVDFVFTGDIGRLNITDDAHFRKTATHLDSETNDADVALLFSTNGTTRRLVRRVNDRKQALLDGHSVDRKTVLTELTGASIAAADRVDNLVNLFRATHLFSQEHQELAKNFREDCELSEEVVTRLLAFEDYARAIGKAEAVRDLMRKEMLAADTDAKSLRQEILEATLQLKRLSQTSAQDVPVEAVGELVEALRRDLATAGILTDREETDVATVRAWRARCEQQLVMSESTLARLSGLMEETATLAIRTTELEKLDVQFAQTESERQANDAQLETSGLQHRRAQATLAERRAARQRIQARVAAAEWALASANPYRGETERLRTIRNELSVAQEALAKHRESIATRLARIRTLEKESTLHIDAIKAARQGEEKVRALLAELVEWRANRDVLARLENGRSVRTEALSKLAGERNRSQHERDALNSEAERGRRQLAAEDQNQTVLRRLVAELEGHVSSGVCPLCGHDHSSQERLLARIRAHVSVDRAAERRADQQRLEGRLAALSEAIAAATVSITALEDEDNRERIQQNTVQDAVLQFESSSRIHGIDPTAGVESTEAGLQTLLGQFSETMQREEMALMNIQSQLASDRNELSGLEADLPIVIAAVEDGGAAEAESQRALDLLTRDERAAHFSPASSDADLARALSTETAQLQEAGQAVLSAEEDEARAKADFESRRQISTRLTKSASETKTRAVELRRSLAETNRKAEEVGLAIAELSETVVAARMDAATRHHAGIRGLRDRTASVERSLDVATTAAVLENLRQTIANKERAEKEAIAKSGERAPWIEYFDTAKSLLFSRQNDAVARFTREYGPRTSVIQRRLRSVYGFDSVDLQSHGSTIRVRVTRGGEELRPTDFFSQSQQQTLLLGLFLTACISQTWSALSPIFLDDPVTHFDDLNTYAFLDLIVGLIESESEQRQFIISTCDEKFLQLARQKGRHLGDRAQFYTFSAIGADGPLVERLAPVG